MYADVDARAVQRALRPGWRNGDARLRAAARRELAGTTGSRVAVVPRRERIAGGVWAAAAQPVPSAPAARSSRARRGGRRTGGSCATRAATVDRDDDPRVRARDQTASGSSSTARAGTAPAPPCRISRIASRRSASIAASRVYRRETLGRHAIHDLGARSPNGGPAGDPYAAALARLFDLPRPVWLLGWVSLATDAATEAIYPLLPFFLTRVLGAGAVSLGIVEGAAEAVNSLLKIVVRPRWPIVADEAAARAVRLRHLVAARPLIALTTTWTQVFAVRVLDRVGKGSAARRATRCSPRGRRRRRRGKVYGFHRGMDHIGAVVGPALASVFLFFYPSTYRTLFALTIIPGAHRRRVDLPRAAKRPMRPASERRPEQSRVGPRPSR